MIRIAAILVGLLLVPVYFLFFRAPAVGQFHDDGVYIVNAQALAGGRGYVTDSLPTPVAQTKYPPLFPVMLAVFAPKFVPLAAGLLWLGVLWLYFRKELGEAQALWIVVLTMASPWVLFLSTNVLSDLVFALFAAAALLAFRKAEKVDRWLLLSAVLADFAYLTRTAGITLMLALLIALAIRRQWKAAVVAGVLFGMAVIPWLAWQAGHPNPTDPILAYYTGANYSQGLAAGNPRVIGFNLLFLTLSFTALSGLGMSPVGMLLSGAIAVLLVIGLIRQRRQTAAIWIVLSVGMMLLWSWRPDRYVVPLLPFLYVYALRAMEGWDRRVVAGLLGIVLGLDAVTLATTTREMQVKGTSVYPGADADDWSKTRQLQEWVKANTPAEAVVSTNCDPQLSLFTGRKAIRLFASDQVLLSYYPDVADKKPLGTAEDLRRHILRHQISFLVVTPMKMYAEAPFFAEQLRSLQAAHPEALRTAYWLDDSYYVLAVDRTKL